MPLYRSQTVQVKDTGSLVGTRRAINFIDGTNVTVTTSDDAANNEVDVTIAATGSGGKTQGEILATSRGWDLV